jgi:hypothetical protein
MGVIERAHFEQVGRAIPRTRQDRERLSLLSRFPQGVDDELERRLLAAYGRDRIEEVGLTVSRDGALDAFLAVVRTASERYRDPDLAVADGFRAVGAEAPAMGRHWVHPDRIVSGVIDPERPTVLSSIDVNGERVLAGVGFAVPGRADRIAAIPGVPAEAWHFHTRSMEAEGHRLDHEARHEGPMDAAGVAVLHAWVWVENPAGPLVPDNWALPYARLGLEPGVGATVEAAKSLSLLRRGADFYARQWTLSFGYDDPGGERSVREALASVEERVRRWWDASEPIGAVPADGDAWLARAWLDLIAFGL